MKEIKFIVTKDIIWDWGYMNVTAFQKGELCKGNLLNDGSVKATSKRLMASDYIEPEYIKILS